MLESGKQRAHEQAIREAARRYAKLHPVPLKAWAQRQEGAVVLSVWFVLPAPKWVTGRRKANSKRTGFEPRATRKPDVDKLLRTVLDGLTGYAYRDDSQVVGFGVVKKSYAESWGGAAHVHRGRVPGPGDAVLKCDRCRFEGCTLPGLGLETGAERPCGEGSAAPANGADDPRRVRDVPGLRGAGSASAVGHAGMTSLGSHRTSGGCGL